MAYVEVKGKYYTVKQTGKGWYYTKDGKRKYVDEKKVQKGDKPSGSSGSRSRSTSPVGKCKVCKKEFTLKTLEKNDGVCGRCAKKTEKVPKKKKEKKGKKKKEELPALEWDEELDRELEEELEKLREEKDEDEEIPPLNPQEEAELQRWIGTLLAELQEPQIRYPTLDPRSRAVVFPVRWDKETLKRVFKKDLKIEEYESFILDDFNHELMACDGLNRLNLDDLLKKGMRRGDIVHILTLGEYRNSGKFIFNGTKVEPLYDEMDEYGSVPRDYTLDEFHPKYFVESVAHNTLRYLNIQNNIGMLLGNLRAASDKEREDSYIMLVTKWNYGKVYIYNEEEVPKKKDLNKYADLLRKFIRTASTDYPVFDPVEWIMSREPEGANKEWDICMNFNEHVMSVWDFNC